MDASAASTRPLHVVESFLACYDFDDLDGVLDLVTEDVVWINVPLPPIRGRTAFLRANRLLIGPRWARLRVHNHHIAENGNVVLTERTDGLVFGRLELRFAVAGRFELRDGKIATWRDSLDFLDLAIGMVRGVAGLVSPNLNRPWPGRH